MTSEAKCPAGRELHCDPCPDHGLSYYRHEDDSICFGNERCERRKGEVERRDPPSKFPSYPNGDGKAVLREDCDGQTHWVPFWGDEKRNGPADRRRAQPKEPQSRSVQRRVAIQKGESMPSFEERERAREVQASANLTAAMEADGTGSRVEETQAPVVMTGPADPRCGNCGDLIWKGTIASTTWFHDDGSVADPPGQRTGRCKREAAGVRERYKNFIYAAPTLNACTPSSQFEN